MPDQDTLDLLSILGDLAGAVYLIAEPNSDQERRTEIAMKKILSMKTAVEQRANPTT